MMTEVLYQKLVRDNIPDLIREEGNTPVVRTLDDQEFEECLREKLREETEEFLENCCLEELSDLLEVLEGFSQLHHWSDWEIQRAKQNKAEDRGAFRERVYLEKVIKGGNT